MKQKMISDFSSIDVGQNKNKLLLQKITGKAEDNEKIDPERLQKLDNYLANMS